VGACFGNCNFSQNRTIPDSGDSSAGRCCIPNDPEHDFPPVRPFASTVQTIPARRRQSGLLTEYFLDLTGENIGSGYIKVTSDQGLASFALFGSLEALSAVPARIVP
jgi:hypothetical protein